MITDLKKAVYKQKGLTRVVLPVYNTLRRRRNFSSDAYWEQRYEKGGNSGAGSYGRLAQFKADFLNKFAAEHKVTSVIEFGSGDGNQLKMFKFKKYVGLDISKTSIAMCIDQYAKDKNKSFYLYDQSCFQDNLGLFKADMTLSLDVVYHLVEDETFEKYMRDMFAASNKYVIIYASNTDENPWGQAQHVRHRKFTAWVERNIKGWTLLATAENRYQFDGDAIDESFADFYVYKKTPKSAAAKK